MVNAFLCNLSSSVTKEDSEKYQTQLLEEVRKIVLSSDPDFQLEELLNADLVAILSDLLVKYDDKRLNFLTLEIFAELAKTDSGRALCADAKIIKLVLGNLLNLSPDPTSNVSLQACRVLGNTCFECDLARNIVKEHNGESLLLKLFEELCVIKDSHDHLRVACGAFINTIADHEILQLSVLSLGVLDICCKIMKTFYHHNDLMKAVLNIIELLYDHTEQINSFLKRNECMDGLVILLKETKDQEIIDSIFEILSTLSENDDSKLALSTTTFPEKLIQLIEERETENAVKFTDLASDFIVLLLTGDKSMDALFMNGEGKVFLKLKSWLSISKSIKLQTAAAFALCNIARSDTNCIYLVESGVADDILAHLKCYPVHEKQHVLQHALVGTLTNLSITVVNKTKMIEMGTVEECLKYLDSESFTVMFKSLGTIRMLLDKNDKLACQLGQNESFLDKLNSFSATKEHEGIRCESWRIVASMIKNAHDSEVMRTMLRHNLAGSLLELFQSKHVIMKNEAIIALILWTSCLDEKPLEGLEEKFCDELKTVLSSENALPEEILSNILILVQKCQKLSSLNAAFIKHGIYEDLKGYKHNLSGQVEKLIDQLIQSS